MEIPEKLLKLRYHIAAAAALSAALFTLAAVAPRFVNLLAYFWPLLLSTAIVLALVFFFAKTSPLPAAEDGGASLDDTLLHYVAGGHHDPPFDTAHNKFD